MKLNLILIMLLSFSLLIGIPMSGDYTVGGTGANFTDLTQAIHAVNASGLSGNVNLKLRAGTYSGPFVIQTTTGAYQLKLMPDGVPATSVILTNPNPTYEANFVLKINETSRVMLQELSFDTTSNGQYSRAVDVSGNCDHLNFTSNIFRGASSMSTSYNEGIYVHESASGEADNLIFMMNAFTDGGAQISISSNSSSNLFENLSFVSNGHTRGYYGVYLGYCAGVTMTGEIVENTNTGVFLNSCSGDLTIQRNLITANYSGINFNNCSPSAGSAPQIRNNIIRTIGTNWYGGSYHQSSVALSIYSCNGVTAAHNSIENVANTSDTYAASISGTNNVLKLNSLVSAINGLAIYASNHEATASNRNLIEYNVLYTVGKNIARGGNTYYRDLSNFAAVIGNTTNIETDPLYSDSQLRSPSPLLNNPNATCSVGIDYNGLPRSLTTPDIGAHEFSPSAGLTPLLGTYTVGNGGNFATLNAATYALALRGISGDVTLNLIDDSYNEQVYIRAINGAGNDNTVLIQGYNGVERSISYSAQSASMPYVVRIARAKGLIFQNLAFETEATTNSNLLYLGGYGKDLRFIGCLFSAPVFSSGGGTHLYGSYDDLQENMSILNCEFTGNNTGIGMNITGLVAGSNYFDNMVNGIIGNPIENAEVTGSAFRNIRGTAITLSNMTYCLVERNSISGTGSGINVNGNCDSVNRSLIANNTIDMRDYYASNGISLSGSGYDVLNNSVRVMGDNSKGLYAYELGMNSDIVNNILVSEGGLAMEIGTFSPHATKIIDHNCYFSTGQYLLRMANYYTSMQSLLADHPGSNQHSKSLNPQFSADMHTTSVWMRYAGMYRSEITTDMDLDPRGTSFDIGADQQTGAYINPVMHGTYTVGATGCDFQTLTDAFDAIELYGIDGNVIINVTAGTYSGYHSFGEYYRTSGAYHVTINALSGAIFSLNPVNNDGTANYIIDLNGVDNVTFSGFNFNSQNTSRQYSFITLRGRCEGITINNSLFSIGNTTSTGINATTSTGTGLSINGCSFVEGSTGIYVAGTYYGSLSYTDVEITDCSFDGVDNPINLAKVVDLSLTGNHLSTFNSGINLQYISGVIDIENNRMRSGGYYGSFSGATIMNLSSVTGSVSRFGRIRNNIIMADESRCQGLYGINAANCRFLNFDHNTIIVENINANDYGSSLYMVSSPDCSFYNNIFSSPLNGMSISISSSADLYWANNVYYTSGKYAGYVNGQKYSFAGMVSVLGDLAGIYADPLPDENGYPDCSFLRGKGCVTAITTDIDGNAYGSSVDPGASRIPDHGTPINGSISVGTGMQYATPQEALSALSRRGISGNTELVISAGTYRTHSIVDYIPNSDLYHLTITGNIGNSPTLRYTANSEAENYLLSFANPRNITLSNLSFITVNPAYSSIVRLAGYPQNVTLDNCSLSTYANSSWNNSAGIYVYDTQYSGITVQDCHFTNIPTAVYAYGKNVTGEVNAGLELKDNSVVNSQTGFYLYNADAPLISGNVITNFSYNGMVLGGNTPGFVITGNTITGGGSSALIITGNSSATGRSVLANNYIMTNANSQSTVNINTVPNLDVYYNTIINSFPSSGNAFYQGSGCSGLRFVNNICKALSGLAGAFYQLSDLNRVDHNLFHATGSTWVTIAGTNISSLSAWAAQTGDNTAIFADPLLSAGTYSLMSGSPAINAGIAIDGYPADITGTLRSLPDMGCFEYNAQGLTPPTNLIIAIDEQNGNISLSWTPVSGATAYKVYMNSIPTDNGWVVQSTTSTSYQIPIAHGYRFFKVTATTP